MAPRPRNPRPWMTRRLTSELQNQVAERSTSSYNHVEFKVFFSRERHGDRTAANQMPPVSSTLRSESHLRAAVGTRQPFASISLCYVHFRVSFDDGMVWTEAGDYANPDPQHPGRYLPPDRGYFPGPLMGLPAESTLSTHEDIPG